MPASAASDFPAYQPAPHLPPGLQAVEQRFHAQLAADPAAALAEYRRRFGHIIDRDNARELFADYAAGRDSRA